ncbi:MAG: MBOAT family protein [Candidatus Eremiobacteraeota bacterium]|nr:MBOAT family protein [Candidatus Eremiobacteraeota bacterium]
MIFNTWLFGLFGVILFVLYWYVVPKAWRAVLLMVAGLVFYSASIPAYLILIFALGAVTYAVIRWLLSLPPEKIGMRRFAMTTGVIASVGVLVLFKYSKLFAITFGSLCQGGCAHLVPNIIVPLAISFFTFEFVHVLVDVYLGKIKRVTFQDFWLFTLFFPTMVAGPIKRYQNFVPQIGQVLMRDRLDGMLFATGLFRVILGLAKKSIIADSMTPLTQPLLAPAAHYVPADYWIGALAYTAKIYFDFTGYSDIAIGVSLLLGFQILENFDRPYWSQNIGIFWRRWHISLSSWIRDYIFIPLGGSRRGKLLTIANLAVVMGLAGLWHGAAGHFVVWGLWHGAGLGIHRLWSVSVAPRMSVTFARSNLVAAISLLTTFLFVVFGWVLFASPTVHVAGIVYAQMLGLHVPL